VSAGQVYLPQVNWLLAAAVLGLVLGFRSSDALANAYGIAVAGDMLVTTLLVTTVARSLWHWPPLLVFSIGAGFLALDLTFVSANIHKIPAGGWFPLMVAAIALTLMLCWRKGRMVALARREQTALDLSKFISGLEGTGAPLRVPGTAIYLTKETDIVPSAMALNVKHNGVLHSQVILLKVTTERSPRVMERQRLQMEILPSGFQLMWLVFGFAEKPDVMAALKIHSGDAGCDPEAASFFIGRETPVPSLRPELAPWQEGIYAFLTRNSVSAADYFGIPAALVIELGTRVEM
jgi:KUP system potassium uptake protein